MSKIVRSSYISFIEKEKRNIFENVVYSVLIAFSFIYSIIVKLRNLGFDKNIFYKYESNSCVVSVGNLSWSGTGKTPLACVLSQELAKDYNIAILRRGYGDDEKKLLLERCRNVFSNRDRAALAKMHEKNFNLFILDDGFQHRRLVRDIDIVIMGQREFQRQYRLIPANFFREPLASLKRADFLILNYYRDFQDPQKIKEKLLKINPKLSIFSANYSLRGYFDFSGEQYSTDYFKNRKIAALAGIGYPKGFFSQLKTDGISLAKEIVYPDHYKLEAQDFGKLQKQLADKGIGDLIITAKDRYHIPSVERVINIFIAEVEMVIDEKEAFLEQLRKKIKVSNKNAKSSFVFK